MDQADGRQRLVRTVARIILVIILAGILIFYGIQFVQNRRNTQNAQDVSKSSNEPKNGSGQPNDQSESSNESAGEVPSGIADSDGSAIGGGSSTTLPDVGMSLSGIYLALVITGSTYLIVWYRQAQSR